MAPVLTVAIALLAVGVLLATNQVLAYWKVTPAVPDVTPWPRAAATAAVDIAIPSTIPSALPAGTPVAAGPGVAGSPTTGPGEPSAVPASPSASPPRGPFSMDLYEKGDYVGEFQDTWCIAAAMQTAMNIMDAGADVTQATQKKLFDLARSLDPAPDGAAEPEGWAQGLTELHYGSYQVGTATTIQAAVNRAARQIRLTNRPAALMVWKGAHTWVMSGFTASADPATTDAFTVTAVRIEDVWYPRFSTIWGYSRPPDANVAVNRLPPDYLPWKRPLGSYPDKNGKFVFIIPVGK